MAAPSRVIEDFKSSGLDFQTLKGLVEFIPPKSLPKELHVPAAECDGAVAFQYYDLEGAPLKYSRYKIYWGPLKGFAARAKDGRPKYLQITGTANHLYIPPIATDWGDVLSSTEQTICITEGEKKTIAMNLRGIPTVGVGGVDSIGNRKRGQLSIPELKTICSGGRQILIVFDIDVGYTTLKPEVARAALVLAQVVLEYGGMPKIVTLPSDGSAKMAVDDWLLTNTLTGGALFFELIQCAKTIDTAVALYAEAEKYVYIEDSNSLGKIKTRDAVLVMDYRVSSGNKQIITQELVMRRQKSGPPLPAYEQVVRTLSDAFLRWPSRPLAHSTTYAPGVEHYLTADGQFNTWKGWAQGVAPSVDASSVAPLWAAFVALYAEDAQTMWNWFMYPIANPGKKLVIIPVIQAEAEGVGKSSIPSFFTKFVYGEGPGTPGNATTLNAMSLKDGRLEYMVNKQFLFLDDANDIHGNDIEALLKNLATTDAVRANPKYIRSYECKNLVNLVITTNRTMSFKVPPQDRRLFFPHVAGDVKPSTWQALHDWGRAGGGAKVVAYAQQLFDSDAVDPYMSAPMTTKKEQVIGIARHPFESFIKELAKMAMDGELSRVVFTGQELKVLAQKDGSIRDVYEVHNHLLHRAVNNAGGGVYAAGRAHRIGDGTAVLYILSNYETMRHERPAVLVAEILKHSLDRLYLKTKKDAKVVPLRKSR